MRFRRRRIFLRRLVLGLAAAAVVVPTAQARLAEGGGSAPPAVSNSAYGLPLVPPSGVRNTVLRRDPSAAQPIEVPKARPVLAPSWSRVPGQILATQREERPSAGTGTSFDWADAGIGFGIIAALTLLAGGAAIGLRRGGRLATGF